MSSPLASSMAARAGPTPLTYISGVERSTSRHQSYNAGSEDPTPCTMPGVTRSLVLLRPRHLRRPSASASSAPTLRTSSPSPSILNDPTSPDHVPARASWRLTRAAARTWSRATTRVDKYRRRAADQVEDRVRSRYRLAVRKVDGVLLESVDGRVHLEQVKPVIAARQAAVHRQAAGLDAGGRARDRPAREGGRRAVVQRVEPALRRDRSSHEVRRHDGRHHVGTGPRRAP